MILGDRIEAEGEGLYTARPSDAHRSLKREPVLLIAKAFPPENVSGAARPYRFFKYLPEHGYDPYVIAAGIEADPVASVHRSPGPHPRRGRKWAARFAAAIQRWVLPYDDSWPWVPYAVSDAQRIVRKQRIGVIFSTSPPLANHMVALGLKLRNRLKWIADFRDPLLGNPFRSREAARYYDAVLEKLIFRFADVVVANTDALAEMWKGRYPDWQQKIQVIWNGYDPAEEFRPAPVADRQRLTLAHIGTIYEGRHPGLLLKSLLRLIEAGLVDSHRIRLRLIGWLDRHRISTDAAPFSRLAALGCLEYTGNIIPAEEARKQMAEADSLILLDMNDSHTKLQVPAKIFDYVRVGRPVLAVTSPGSPSEWILRGSGIRHVCIDPTAPPEQIDRQVLQFLELPTEPCTPSRWFREQFDARAHSETLAQILDSFFERETRQ